MGENWGLLTVAALLVLLILILMLLVQVARLKERLNAAEPRGAELELRLEQGLRQGIQQSMQQNAQQGARQNEALVSNLTVLGNSLRDMQDRQQEKLLGVLNSIRQENSACLEQLRRENSASLERINDTVNEKLQKTLDDRISRSFEAVNKRLAEVYVGLGEMKTVAAGVADLKNVLANVKTRGIMGEIQLAAILEEILAPEQYAAQVGLKPGSAEKVDFAVKLPGQEEGGWVYLPVDAKFPGDTYSRLLAAYEAGDPEGLRACRAALEAEIKRCAKSIHDKYIAPPQTTDFAVMFLPFEGLYAEVVNMGLVEPLLRSFRVSIAGPSTMAAMLNSLQMGFRTLAVQRKSGEVWQVLEAAKKEFANFEKVLLAARNRLRQADEELDRLIGTRTRAINRQLKEVAEPDGPKQPDKTI